MTFSSKEPVYPLKLTAVAGGSTAFEVFVIADDRAACDLLKEEFCDRFTENKRAHLPEEEDPHETDMDFSGETTHWRIGHPAICALMWNNCILTKFAGTIDAGKMTSDIQFDWKRFKPYQQHFYTIQGKGRCLPRVRLLHGQLSCSLDGCVPKEDSTTARAVAVSRQDTASRRCVRSGSCGGSIRHLAKARCLRRLRWGTLGGSTCPRGSCFVALNKRCRNVRRCFKIQRTKLPSGS